MNGEEICKCGHWKRKHSEVFGCKSETMGKTHYCGCAKFEEENMSNIPTRGETDFIIQIVVDSSKEGYMLFALSETGKTYKMNEKSEWELLANSPKN